MKNFVFAAFGFLAVVLPGTPARAELREQPTPFSVWLDLPALASLNAAHPPFPIWLESVEAHSTDANGPEERTTYRLRLRRMGGLNQNLLLRVFFHDSVRPRVSAWSETGAVRMEPRALGVAAGLDSSESVIIPALETDYIDVEVAGDGSTLRGAFLATLKKTAVWHALDFHAAPELEDPFDGPPPASGSGEDTALLGRVRARLDDEVVRLGDPEDRAVEFEFDLTAVPLVAAVSFEVLDADVAWPLEVIVNNRAAEQAAIALPDLADPGYAGRVVALEADMRFHYTGWLRAQRIVPGAALKVGTNRIILRLPRAAGPVAIRHLDLQLKFNSPTLDYRLQPIRP